MTRSLTMAGLAVLLAVTLAGPVDAQRRGGGGAYHGGYAPHGQWNGGQWNGGHWNGGYGYHGPGPFVGGALLGLGAGALLGGALVAPPQHRGRGR